MNKDHSIDFSKLLGFQVISDELAERVDSRMRPLVGDSAPKSATRRARFSICRQPPRQITIEAGLVTVRVRAAAAVM